MTSSYMLTRVPGFKFKVVCVNQSGLTFTKASNSNQKFKDKTGSSWLQPQQQQFEHSDDVYMHTDIPPEL